MSLLLPMDPRAENHFLPKHDITFFDIRQTQNKHPEIQSYEG
jgi:hypothetical protein